MQIAMRISGAGVSPFTLEKQRRLINVFADATGNISVSQFSILLVGSAFSSRHRSLLQAATVVHIYLCIAHLLSEACQLACLQCTMGLKQLNPAVLSLATGDNCYTFFSIKPLIKAVV